MKHNYNSDNNEESYPIIEESMEHVQAYTYQGVISLDIEICVNLVENDVKEEKIGTCGYCGEKSRIKSFTKSEQEYIFIYLCDHCESNLRSDLKSLFENNSADLTSKYI